MKFGLFGVNIGAGTTSLAARTGAILAEQLAFESLWTIEHVVVPSAYSTIYPYDESGKMMGGEEEVDIPDPLIWLSHVAAVTERIKLATGIVVLPQRNPVVTAKEVATLDHLSGGRVLLGVGAGWLREEFEAIGAPFEDRGTRLDNYIEAMRALWKDTRASTHNAYVDFDNAISLPHPPLGAVPIVIGGHSARAARRAGRIGDGFFPTVGSADELAKLVDIMKAEAHSIGRDPSGIEVTVPLLEDVNGLETKSDGSTTRLDSLSVAIEAMENAGAGRVVFGAPTDNSLPVVAESLAGRFGMEVGPTVSVKV